MIAILCILVAALVAIVYLLLRHQAAAEARWTLERRELLTRIQHPERIPADPAEPFEIPEREPDEWARVGQIEISDKYGLTDDD